MLLNSPLANSWKVPYEDTKFTSTRDGVTLPNTSSDVLRRLYPLVPWNDWGCIRMDESRCFFVLPNGRPVLKSTVQKQFGSQELPIRSLATYMTLPNGQVKNFLNAFRACVAVRGPVRVAVIGSKAAESGGLWHKYFAMWLAMQSSMVVVDFYDMAETEDEWSVLFYGSTISCQWFPQKVDSAFLTTQNYDVVIDDIWSFETGVGLVSWNPQSVPFFSYKGAWDSPSPFIPFLHSTETRWFSHPPPKHNIGGCFCAVCEVCKQCSTSYESYVFLRTICGRLGHSLPCVGISFLGELGNVAQVHRDLATMPRMEIKGNYALRALMAVSEEMGISVSENFAWKEDVPVFIPISRKFQRGIRAVADIEWLRKKRIMFCGVSADILGTTDIRRVAYTTDEESCDIAFVSSVEVWYQRLASPVVYAPVKVALASKEFPDWYHTGKEVGAFLEYVRRPLPSPVVETWSIPVQKVKKDVYPASQIFPFIISPSVDIQNYVHTLTTGTLHSLIPQLKGVYLGHFNPLKWRTSVVLHGRVCALFRNNLHLCPEIRSILYAARPLPWDMRPDEVKLFEEQSGYFQAQQSLRLAWSQSFVWSVFKKKKVIVCGKTIALENYFGQQKEFHIEADKLSRSFQSHPALQSDWALYPDWFEKMQVQDYDSYEQIALRDNVKNILA